MLINLRNALMAGKRLPYDAEIEFLESTGTQWIDTGYVPNANSDIRLSVQFTSTATQQMGVGRQSSSQWALLCGFYKSKVCAWVNVQQNTSILASSTDRIDIFFNCATGTYGGGSTTFSGLVPPSEQVQTFGLFARNNGNDRSTFCSCRIFSFKVYENGVLVRDFIPVRKGTVGYLYDRVSGKLFGNAGTGDFALGPDVVPVEYIESHGTEYINTGIILNDTYGIDINFAPMETASGVSEYGVFGSSVSGSGIRHNVLQIHSSAGGVGLWMPSNTRICNYAITIGEYQHWQINLNDSDEVVIDNVLKAHTHPTTPAECQYPVYLFGRDVANTLKSGSCSKMRLATWMVCDGSGNLIQKGLPIRVGTDATSWEGAMMDVLTRRIYRNAGTGAFGYGNDLKYPIPAS